MKPQPQDSSVKDEDILTCAPYAVIFNVNVI